MSGPFSQRIENAIADPVQHKQGDFAIKLMDEVYGRGVGGIGAGFFAKAWQGEPPKDQQQQQQGPGVFGRILDMAAVDIYAARRHP
jgi:hypothetical protein